jgi:PKD repeat protein
MQQTIRSFSLGLGLLLLGSAMAQTPYTLYVTGQLEGCSAGQMVTVQTMPGTMPETTMNVPVAGDCSFQAALDLDSPTGGIFAWSSCGNGTVTGDSTIYAINDPSDSSQVTLSLHCDGGSTGACQACITVTQDSSFLGAAPFSAQFSSCSTGGTPPYSYSWLLPDGSISLEDSPDFLFSGPGAFGICLLTSDATGCTSAACDTVIVGADGTINPPNAPDCQAGFWVIQAYTDTSNGGGILAPVPNEVWVWNLSNGSTDIDSYMWDFGDGNTSAEAYPTHVYDGDGPWLLCLTITSGSCSDTYCDTVSVDEDGLLNGMVVPNEGHPSSPHSTVRTGGFTLNVLQSIPTGVAELPAAADLRLWPNPAQEALNIAFNNSRVGVVPVAVVDLSGRTLVREDHDLAPGINTLRLNTADLQPGLYMVRIGNDAHSVAHRFLKVR